MQFILNFIESLYNRAIELITHQFPYIEVPVIDIALFLVTAFLIISVFNLLATRKAKVIVKEKGLLTKATAEWLTEHALIEENDKMRQMYRKQIDDAKVSSYKSGCDHTLAKFDSLCIQNKPTDELIIYRVTETLFDSESSEKYKRVKEKAKGIIDTVNSVS